MGQWWARKPQLRSKYIKKFLMISTTKRVMEKSLEWIPIQELEETPLVWAETCYRPRVVPMVPMVSKCKKILCLISTGYPHPSQSRKLSKYNSFKWWRIRGQESSVGIHTLSKWIEVYKCPGLHQRDIIKHPATTRGAYTLKDMALEAKAWLCLALMRMMEELQRAL
jgi:hypothetical protein